jgi:exodeoxyribonuclease X
MDKTKLVFLDTETTGLGPDDRLFQVAYIFNGEQHEALFRPPVPITIDAMVVTHVTNEMVADKDPFEGSQMQAGLRNLLAENILVAHNAKFDAEMLRREGVEARRIIDTFKVAYHLDPEGTIPKYNLQYLRDYHGLEVGEVSAHHALGDVIVLEKLFGFYFDRMLAVKGDERAVLQEMLDVSVQPLLIRKFTFGKYNGMDVADVAKQDPDYLAWLLNQKIMTRENGGEDDENWIYTLDYYFNLSK